MSPRLLTAACALLATACPKGPGLDTGELVPDFAIEDVNASSVSFGELVSPRDFEGIASAWYFGHAS
jgi:hypothetical protein